MYITSEKFHSCHNANVLVLVLIVISAMTIIAFGLAYQTRMEIRLSKSSSQQVSLQHIAMSGIEAGKAVLSGKELTCEQTARICRFYSTKDNLKLFEQLKSPLNEDIQIAFWIRDESSFLDLNKSNPAIWENLPALGRDKIACILDWIDKDSDTNPDGAESDYYKGLEPSYSCKNDSLICLKELLFVNNITRDDYLGGIIHDEMSDPEDIEQQLSLINTFTTFSQETVNINTVPGMILLIFPGLDQEAVDILLAFRTGPDGLENTDDDQYFQNAEDILQLEGLTDLHKELLGQYCCFNSDIFRVFSYARLNQQSCFLMATVRAVENKPEIICIERLL